MRLARPHFPCVIWICLGLLGTRALAADVLENERLRVDFDANGISGIVDKASGQTFSFGQETFAITIDGQTLRPDPAAAATTTVGHARVARQNVGRFSVETTYELRPGWRFVSKQLSIISSVNFHINRIQVLDTKVDEQLSPGQMQRFSAFLRPIARSDPATSGLFLTLQNPFAHWTFPAGHAAVDYAPDMDWATKDGAFESDRVCIGVTTLTGSHYQLPLIPEWQWVSPADSKPRHEYIDRGELQAMNDCVRAFLLQPRDKSIRVQVGWCVNDYQIDLATPDGREAYKRVMNRAAQLGCGYQLFSPTDSRQSKLADNTDAWGWENVLWFGMGQQQRRGTWDAKSDPLPAEIVDVLDYAKTQGVKPLAYVYPTLNYQQDPAWTAWIKTIKDAKPGGYRGVDTAVRSYQDWFVDQLVGFYNKQSVGGFSFDHWWIAYDEASSKYAQWYGCRRILEELRRRLPDAVIDGRQQYQHFGPWTWLGGTYPHPTGTDEQPLSFRAFPDLHIDRVSADRQRYSAWWYRVLNDCPPELMPGFMTHQTPREDAKGIMRRDTFRMKDWDSLGWKYSLISSIATAPFNHVINMIPARDPEEYAAFSKTDQAWFRGWLDWTDAHIDLLRDVHPILNQPMLGRVDGTAAFKDDRGVVFLFNPNYRRTRVTFKLDSSIGLTAGKPMTLRQLYPDAEKGMLMAGPGDGAWRPGDTVTLDLPGTEALVLEVSPTADNTGAPQLLGTVGQARLEAGQLIVDGVRGPAGEMRPIKVVLPTADPLATMAVNGVAVPHTQTGRLIQADIHFAGNPFGRCHEVGHADAANIGGTFTADLTIPKHVFDQLRTRREQWTVTYTPEDLQATWLGADRLLLFVNVAEPQETMKVSLKIDGRDAVLKPAYTSIDRNVPEHTFVGWYIDLSDLSADRSHTMELSLPTLKPGQFQGMFFDNVETEWTDVIVTSADK